MIRHAVIRCAWDSDAGVWFVQETDIPGLMTEAPTLDALRRKLPIMIRDLDAFASGTEVELDLIAHAHERIRFEAA
ncbi:DUF1902 domain-containing protein [Methylobacterium sp. Leaf466]|uniref:DUF1902 domain-containing protein n=1 Tax=Methylobacterium sp. Leaf466 TaxID=1736386 RepID=UPI0006F59E7B|nr:DUF1902 domain-containing protein [Methylobacterium sp. Leaf466]KQT78333.1 hypothetical protein ASG59_09690 [Methylobacterium sp. Leaf466]